ncbi:MAG: hypothetical protein H7A32_03975 [Deltaproteobacteria bacterium]|nr:hypothetical protein [Deltaproteobacteria bacterium]
MYRTQLKKNIKILRCVVFAIILLPSSVFSLTFQSKHEGFIAYFPQKPQQVRLIEKTFVGNVPHKKFFVKNKTSEWAIDVSEIPEIATVFSSSSSIYEKAKKAFLKDANAKELSFQKVSLKQVEGRELHYKKKSGIEGKVRFFLKDKKLYTVVAELPKEKLRQVFFQAFQLTP